MTGFKKKILFWLMVLAIISPLGLFFPDLFHKENAWGEWDVSSVKEKTGYELKGMAKDAELWKAPIADYRMKEDASLSEQSIHYIISGVTGFALVVLITYGLTRLLVRHEKTS